MKRMLTVLGVCLSGCASTAKFEARLDTWVGQNVSKLVEEWGIPSATFTVPDGKKLYEYTYQGGSQTYASYNQYTNGVTARTNSYWCKTTFIAHESGLILSWRWEGNACRTPN